MQQLIKELKLLNLSGMAHCLENQPTDLNHDLSFEERLELLVHHELTLKRNRKVNRLLRSANLKHSLALEEISWDEKRGLSRSQYLSLLRLDFFNRHQNIIITGATGCGKTYLANAIGNKACREGYTVKFIKLALFLEELTLNHKTGSFYKILQELMKYDLLILDDLGLTPIDKMQLHDLVTIIDERFKTKSTIITSQLPVSSWHGYLGDLTLADAFLDRLLSQSQRIELSGDSLRWQQEKNDEQPKLTEGGK